MSPGVRTSICKELMQAGGEERERRYIISRHAALMAFIRRHSCLRIVWVGKVEEAGLTASLTRLPLSVNLGCWDTCSYR